MMTTKFACTAALAVVLGACSQAPAEDPQEAAAPQEGVYGVAPAPVGGTPSVVMLIPASPDEHSPERRAQLAGAEPRVIDQLGLAFSPTTLLVPVGGRVVFTNSESLAHNVHVRSADTDSTVLNVDTDPGGRVEHTFTEPGGYHVLCDVHPGMRAFIYVTPSPWAVFAEQDGSFRLPGVPVGSYVLRVWSADSTRRAEGTVEVTGTATEVTLSPSG